MALSQRNRSSSSCDNSGGRRSFGSGSNNNRRHVSAGKGLLETASMFSNDECGSINGNGSNQVSTSAYGMSSFLNIKNECNIIPIINQIHKS